MPRQAPSLQTVAIVLAWLVLIGLAAATLVPLGLRPHSGLSPQAERFIAFAIAGLCLALAYPRRPLLIVIAIVGTALGLEAAQYLAINRHPGLPDLIAKLTGGAAGLVLGLALRAIATALRRG
ncbi:MAG TPA: VanZ family protein [Devosia sp.]